MKKTLTLLIMLLMLATAVFVSCDSNANGTENGTENETEDAELGAELFNVSFDLDGGDGYIHEQNVVKGGKLEEVRHPEKQGFYFCGWKTDKGKAFNITTDKVNDDMVLIADWKDSFKVGDTGPGGGVIFYVADGPKDSVYTDSSGHDNIHGWKYLEAARSDAAKEIEWGIYGDYDTETAIGTGWSNTEKLKQAGITRFPAARACTEYRNNGFSDWFMPSKYENNALYEAGKKNSSVKDIIPEHSFWTTNNYWSSSEIKNDCAWWQYFNDGNLDYSERRVVGSVRPIRSF